MSSPTASAKGKEKAKPAFKSKWIIVLSWLVACIQLACMAGPGNDPVQVFRTLRDLHWEFLRLWTGFELPSSWHTLSCYGTHRNRNILDFMRWPHIGLGPQDLNDIQRPKSFQTIAGSKVLDEYYNTYLRK
jgi:hypothetical protein